MFGFVRQIPKKVIVGIAITLVTTTGALAASQTLFNHQEALESPMVEESPSPLSLPSPSLDPYPSLSPTPIMESSIKSAVFTPSPSPSPKKISVNFSCKEGTFFCYEDKIEEIKMDCAEMEAIQADKIIDLLTEEEKEALNNCAKECSKQSEGVVNEGWQVCIQNCRKGFSKYDKEEPKDKLEDIARKLEEKIKEFCGNE